MPDDLGRDLVRSLPVRDGDDETATREPQGTLTLRGEEYAIRTLLASGPARVYTLSSIGAATGAATRDALWALGAHVLRQVSFLAPHIPIVELPHERPDGRGYPLGLSGDEIPLAARIVHVADAFDAITRARAYRPGRDTETAITEIQRHSGTDFDPEAVDALLAILPFAETSPVLAPGAVRVHQHV